jgi:hypothetical protein
MSLRTHELPTTVLEESFETFLADRADGDTIAIGYDGESPPNIEPSAVDTLKTRTVTQDDHDSHSDYFDDTLRASFDTVAVSLPPTGYFSRAGAVLAAEELLMTNGQLIVRVRGRDVPGWAKLDMNNTDLTEFVADVPTNRFEDARPITVYTKRQDHLGRWA